MQKWISSHARPLAVLGIVVLGYTAMKASTLVASDHLDSALVEMSPRFDINDVYAFPSPTDASKTVLVLSTASPISPAQTPTFTFGHKSEQLYQIKIDNTGDAREDLVFQFTFTGPAGKQKVTMRGPMAPNSVGTTNSLIGGKKMKGYTNTILTSNEGVKLFAGPRDDPFFIDLERFLAILPDRRPEGGPLSQITQISPLEFREVGDARDFLVGFNDMAIVVELPTAMLSPNNTRFGVWATTSRATAN